MQIKKAYFDGAEITRVKDNKFYIIGYKNEERVKEFIANKFNIKEFLCIWRKTEKVKVN